MDQVLNWIAAKHLNVPAVVGTSALLVLAVVAAFLINRFTQHTLQALAVQYQWHYTTVYRIKRAISAALFLVTVFLVLDIWGVGLTGLWTFIVSAVTVIGVGFLATWTMISNITANVFIAIWRPFLVGDVVEVLPENLKGRVVERNMMFTVLREDNGSVIRVPNNLFFQKMFRVVDSRQRNLFEVTKSTRNRPAPSDLQFQDPTR